MSKENVKDFEVKMGIVMVLSKYREYSKDNRSKINTGSTLYKRLYSFISEDVKRSSGICDILDWFAHASKNTYVPKDYIFVNYLRSKLLDNLFTIMNHYDDYADSTFAYAMAVVEKLNTPSYLVPDRRPAFIERALMLKYEADVRASLYTDSYDDFVKMKSDYQDLFVKTIVKHLIKKRVTTTMAMARFDAICDAAKDRFDKNSVKNFTFVHMLSDGDVFFCCQFGQGSNSVKFYDKIVKGMRETRIGFNPTLYVITFKETTMSYTRALQDVDKMIDYMADTHNSITHDGVVSIFSELWDIKTCNINAL